MWLCYVHTRAVIFQETSALVDRQGDEMLKLIKNEKEQLAKDMQEQLENAKVSGIYLCAMCFAIFVGLFSKFWYTSYCCHQFQEIKIILDVV